jgi:hypothetical protein
MLKIKIKNCCCCCNSNSGGNSGGNGGGNSGGGTTTTKYTVTIGAPIDKDNNIVSNPTILVDGEEKQVGDTIEVDAGSTITVKVTADGYEDFEQEYPINESQTITPTLIAAAEAVYYTITVKVMRPSSGTTTKIDGEITSEKRVLAGTNHTINVTSDKIYYDAYNQTINNIQKDETVKVWLDVSASAKADHDPNFHLYFGGTGESSWEYDPVNQRYTMGDSGRSDYISDAEGQSATFNVFSYNGNSSSNSRVGIDYSISDNGSDYLDVSVEEATIGTPGYPAFTFTITKKANAPAISSDKSFNIIIQQDNTDYSNGTYGKGDGKEIKCRFELRHA